MNIGSRKKLHFHPNIYITLYFNVSSTLLQKNRNTDFRGGGEGGGGRGGLIIGSLWYAVSVS